jgi:hypothetical protein
MVLKMPHLSMRRPCGRITHKFLKKLKKFECIFVYKCARLCFDRWNSWSHISEISCLICVGALERKWYNLRECDAVNGVHFLGLCRSRGMRDCWLELLQEL